MADSISGVSDSELLQIAGTFHDAIATGPTNFGLTTGQVTALETLFGEYSGALTDHAQAQATAKSKTQAKTEKRFELEAMLRQLRNIAKANQTSDALMASLGLPSSSSPAPQLATQPQGVVDTSERLRHTIQFFDSAGNGNKRRPRGTMGCEIWVKVDGAPPGSEKDCTFLAIDSSTPYIAEYDAANGGKMAHYMLRWRMRDGTLGPWGETVSATITA
jgi:hypothetical protein